MLGHPKKEKMESVTEILSLWCTDACFGNIVGKLSTRCILKIFCNSEGFTYSFSAAFSGENPDYLTVKGSISEK